jgi:hypothetical protein
MVLHSTHQEAASAVCTLITTPETKLNPAIPNIKRTLLMSEIEVLKTMLERSPHLILSSSSS